MVEGLFDEIYDLNNDVNDINDLGNELNKFNYKYHPKDFKELRHLVKQLLNERGKDADLNDIDVSQLTTFYNNYERLGLFQYLDPHNIDINQWNVSNVEDMFSMFYGCENFDGDLSNWNVSKVEDMGYMFYGCENFNCNLSKWNVSKVEDMHTMFAGCKNFTGQGLENWNVSNVKNIETMFYNCTSLKKYPTWYKK